MDTFSLVENKYGTGWLADAPDFRDYTVETEQVGALLKQTRLPKTAAKSFKAPSQVDLRAWCPPIEDQGALGSCTANAAVGMVEYFEHRMFGNHLEHSRLFVYKVTRNLLGWSGDTGAFLRTTMGALALFGAPPEKVWAYNIANFDTEPPAFCYAYGQNFNAAVYYRLDPPGTTKNSLLNAIKTHAATGIPSMFGFTVYTSIAQAKTTGKIPYPTAGDRVAGGHAVMVVGYDDTLQIKHVRASKATTGAFIIRNSWGVGWGDSGYGYLPYDYVLNGLAVDWWVLIRNEWVNTGIFD